MRWNGAALLLALAPGPTAAAQPVLGPTPVSGPIVISHAWTPAREQAGGNNPLYMTIANNGDVSDRLIRARCPAAEKVAIDKGGSPSARDANAIAIPAGQSVTLAPDTDHIVLLHTTAPLLRGQTVSCTVTFRKSGERLVEVTVAPAGATTPP